MILFVIYSNTLIFLFTILLFSSYGLCNDIKVGYLYQSADTTDPLVDVLSKAILDRFSEQIESKDYPESILFINFSCNTRGDDLTMSLDKLKSENVKHIFSPIIFSNFTVVNEKLQNYGMILWSSTAQLNKACHSNIIYYGSERKLFEQCIFFNFYFLLIYIIDILYSSQEKKNFIILYQEDHPYANIIEYVQELMKFVGATLLPLDPWKKDLPSSSPENQQILSAISNYTTDCDNVDIIVMLEHNVFTTIVSTSPFSCTPLMIAVDGYDFNYYNDVSTTTPSTPLSYYILFDFYKSISDLLTISNYETDPIVFKLYIYI